VNASSSERRVLFYIGLSRCFREHDPVFQATATDSPGHFVASNRALTNDSRRCGSDTESLCARVLEQMKSDKARKHVRASIFPRSGTLAIGGKSITVEGSSDTQAKG
jgi:hypothetical protein